MSQRSVSGNFLQALAAVLVGNLAYYALMPYLPVRARHVVFRQDWGIVVDFSFCMVAFGLIKTLTRWIAK